MKKLIPLVIASTFLFSGCAPNNFEGKIIDTTFIEEKVSGGFGTKGIAYKHILTTKSDKGKIETCLLHGDEALEGKQKYKKDDYVSFNFLDTGCHPVEHITKEQYKSGQRF